MEKVTIHHKYETISYIFAKNRKSIKCIIIPKGYEQKLFEGVYGFVQGNIKFDMNPTRNILKHKYEYTVTNVDFSDDIKIKNAKTLAYKNALEELHSDICQHITNCRDAINNSIIPKMNMIKEKTRQRIVKAGKKLH
jgi:hypothetical protein